VRLKASIICYTWICYSYQRLQGFEEISPEERERQRGNTWRKGRFLVEKRKDTRQIDNRTRIPGKGQRREWGSLFYGS